MEGRKEGRKEERENTFLTSLLPQHVRNFLANVVFQVIRTFIQNMAFRRISLYRRHNGAPTCDKGLSQEGQRRI